MFLESVHITNFRSLENTNLASCGTFNVLIGKNNSGKSNILLAIDALFDCLRSESVISLDPPIGTSIDFTNQDTLKPIEIVASFILELAERDELIRDVVTEAPQRKNAVDGIDPELRLSVAVCVTKSPARYAYIRQMSLIDVDGTIKTPILNIGKEASSEIHTSLSRKS